MLHRFGDYNASDVSKQVSICAYLCHKVGYRKARMVEADIEGLNGVVGFLGSGDATEP